MGVRRTTGAVVATAAVLALASAVYQKVGEARDRRRHAPPGRLVAVGRRRLHVRCAGSGSPAVVVIPAMGDTLTSWLAVQDALAPLTTVVVYDRPGLGWSDPAPGFPTATGMARELRELLDAAEVQPPFVVVGHSLGGLVARVFAHVYGAEVTGLALVDSSHPAQASRLPKHKLRDHRGGELAEAALEFAQPLGLRRAWRDLRRDAGDSRAELSSRYRRAWLKEMLVMDRICYDTGVITGSLGHLPLTVITSSERSPSLEADSRAQRVRSRFYAEWATLQDELAALSDASVHVVAPFAGHHVHRDDPALVVDALTRLVQRAQER